jgi:hypothetical protein
VCVGVGMGVLFSTFLSEMVGLPSCSWYEIYATERRTNTKNFHFPSF